MRVFLPVAGFFGFCAMLLAALGDHVFVHSMTAQNYQDYQLALNYELFHSMALMVIGLFGFVTRKPFKLLQLSAYLMIVGVVFFCGDIFMATVYNVPKLDALVPVGGTAFLLAWAVLFVAGVYYYFRSVHAHDL